MNINKKELFSKISINVVLISMFIGFFFFTYGSFIEQQIIKNQMEFLAEDLCANIKLFGFNFKQQILNSINKYQLPDLKKEDIKTEKINQEIINKFIKINVIFVSLVVFIIYFFLRDDSYDMQEIITENIIILVCVGLTEFVFLAFFAAKFISIDPSKTKLTILQSLHKN